MNCRDNNSKKLSGGLVTFIKRNIVHGIQLIDKSVIDMLWFKLDKGFFKLPRDLYLCFVYIVLTVQSSASITVHSQALESKLCKSYLSCPNQKYNLRKL
jgi:hypothetical protein